MGLPQPLSAGSRLGSTCWTAPLGQQQQQQQQRLPAPARLWHTHTGSTKITLKPALGHAWRPQVGQLSRAGESSSTCEAGQLLRQVSKAAAGQLQAAQRGRQRCKPLGQLQAVVPAARAGAAADVQLPQRQPGAGDGWSGRLSIRVWRRLAGRTGSTDCHRCRRAIVCDTTLHASLPWLLQWLQCPPAPGGGQGKQPHAVHPQVGQGRQTASWMSDLLAARDRTKGAPTFMPDGLYLSAIEYAPEFGLHDLDGRAHLLSPFA